MTRPKHLSVSLALLILSVGGGAAFGGGSAELAVEEATRQFASTGRAPVIERSDSVIFPFGESQPVLQCSPLRACDVELEAGEVVHGVALGDTERWISSPLYSGDPEALIPHVVVKPRDYGISTNLIVTTTRRTYHLTLEAPPKSKASDSETGYLRRVRFYYPGAMVQQWSDAAQVKEALVGRSRAATVASLTGAMDPGGLNFDYSLAGSRRAPFRPVTVFDDGHHTYIKLPEAAGSSDAPAFLAKTVSGDEVILNYRMDGRWIVVDGRFERGELVAGVGSSRRTVRITNRAFDRSAGGR